MNIDSLERIEVKKTLSDEIGVYFIGGEEEYLAFPFSSAKEGIFSGKRIAQLLQVQYNISNEVEFLKRREQEQKTEITEVSSIKVDTGGTRMVKKAGNIRKVAKEMLESGKTQQEVLDSLIQSYKDLGKDDKYSDSRARVVLVSVLKKMGLEVSEGIKKTRKTKKSGAEETPVSPVNETTPENPPADGEVTGIENIEEEQTAEVVE